MCADNVPGKARDETTPVTREPLGFVSIPADIVAQHANVYVMRVIGDCMTGDHIRNGDYVLVDPDEQVHDGDIAVVRITNWQHSCTGSPVEGRVLKRLRCGGTVLEPSNPAYMPMILRPEHNAVIEGRVFGVIRDLEDESAE